MRKIQTFILRLLMNSDEPHVMRGIVSAVASDEAHTFEDGGSLLDWLQRMSGASEDEQEGEHSDVEGQGDAR